MDSVKPPAPLKMTGNVDANWKIFKQQFMLYISAVGVDSRANERKIALLLTIAGAEAIDVFNTFTYNEPEDKDKFDEVIKKFDEHCVAKKNETYERYVFRSRLQQPGESFDVFLTDLKIKAQSCNFGDLKNSMIRDQIVFGTNEKKLREKLLRETELTLESAIRIVQANELAKQHALTLQGATIDQENETVKAVTMKGKTWNKFKQKDKFKDNDQGQYNCKKCGEKHKPRQCPAFGKTCAKCKKQNHYAKMCFTKKKIQTVQGDTDESDDLSDTFFIKMVSCDENYEQLPNTSEKVHTVNTVKEDKWTVPLLTNGTIVTFKIDTGAKANLINEKDMKALTEKPKRLSEKAVTLKAYNNQPIKTMGVCRLKVTVKGKQHNLMFTIVPNGHESILGDKASEDLGLVRRVYQINNENIEMDNQSSKLPQKQSEESTHIVDKYSSVFKGHGTLPYTYKIQLKEDATPVVHAPRRVPAPLKAALKKELNRMTQMGVIERVEEPTDWVNSITCVKKRNTSELRVCLDPKDLNENIKREHYQIPKREEILSDMAGARYFSKLDASHGFWQLKLDPESSRYTTFNTPFGRYCFLRLPFGIKSAPEIFHKAMESIIEGLEGTRVYIDDLVVWGTTKQQHDERLEKLLQRVKKFGLKLKREKCLFGVMEMTFLGDKLTANGVLPDKTKVQAILNMPAPTDKKGVLRAMGMINFLGKFIPNLSSKTTHLRELLRHNVVFEWTTKHEKEWKELKKTITVEPVLTFFDPAKPTKISTDASKDGLGAVLLQKTDEKWQPVAYASRSMTETEKRYAQIEKETLGLVFGCGKFHSYVYGLPTFTAETDHKPLISIRKKNLNDMSPRIQRMMMSLQRYDFELIYTPGKYIVLADALSRAPAPNSETSESITAEDAEAHIKMITASLPATDSMLQQIVKETAMDSTLNKVTHCIRNDWTKGVCPQFFPVRAELCMSNGLLLRNNRIVIPQTMRKDMLHRLHEGHLGVEKCKRRAREAIYWPGINKDIEEMIQKCEICLKHHYKQVKEPMLVPELPTAPWEKVGTDLFHLHGKDYLLLIDYYSNYPEIAQLTSTTAQSVITHLKGFFARHGIPHCVVSDNGPQYDSANGQAEKGVQIVKRLLKKAKDGEGDPYLALLSYRAAPLECGASPAELLMGRKLRTTLPQITVHNNKNWIDKKKKLKHRQKMAYDKSTRRLEPLFERDSVRIEGPDCWDRKATVLSEVGPRSFVVETEDGQRIRRNRRSLLKTNVDIEKHTDEAESENQNDTSKTQPSEPLVSSPSTEPLRRSTRQRKPPERLIENV
ncbi:hypothetical protein WMY93_004384 [Mugilogobius chulae]|uniref:Gypsy retrotransposon integrase-like protein 1 n=1 Tax=Mugilogobius chulae TaxID=88201 RepID=A0AAW0PQZ7_9GOBI